jgi:purine-binding chemotaxis protein CheW
MSVACISEIRQYLTFKLSDEVFGVDVAQVREILDCIKVTKIPQTPEFMCGVINLRGNVVPIVDMRLKFGMEKSQKTVNTCIVVVEVNLEDETAILGALVDSVQEVFELDPKDIEPTPKIGTKMRVEFIKGMGKRDEQFIMILDIDKVFSSDDLSVLKNMENSCAEKELVHE